VIAFFMAEEIRHKKSGTVIFISTSTSSGLERIQSMERASDEPTIDGAFLAPFDHPFITGRFVKRIQPTSFILVETEIWPALIHSMHGAGIPITIINGKMSRRSFRRYAVLRFALKDVLGMISLICAQSRSYARRFHTLGVPRERIEILGNVKFDSLPDRRNYDAASKRALFGIPPDAKVFVAGSTRPGEEEVIARAFLHILKVYPGAVLICAPRHLNRVNEVERIFSEAGIPFAKRSSGKRFDASRYRVFLLDTMGELLDAYACADVAFVGGSLRDFGGHNPMEPAALGVPVLFGPYMEQTGSKELLAQGASALVHDDEDLAGTVELLFAGGDQSRRMGAAGQEVVGRFKGTRARTIRMIENHGLI
jgi:3-deoxy-D-manno-octulosonic-acid transferase